MNQNICMIKHFQLVVIAISFWSGVSAQDTTAKIRISEFHIQHGTNFQPIESTSLEDFQRLAPNSTLLQSDFTGFNMGNNYMFYRPFSFGSASYNSLQLGLTLKNNPSLLWRIGISHGSTGDISNWANRNRTAPYDTLTSSQTGEQYFIDSTYSENYFMSYSAQQLRLESSVIFRTNPAKRWSIYAGAGMSFGVSYKAETYINYFAYSSNSAYNANYDYASNVQSSSEHFRNKMSISTSVFVPMGIDFRIGKNREFWKRLHVYYEMKPSLTVTSIPELRTSTQVNMINTLGLKITF